MIFDTERCYHCHLFGYWGYCALLYLIFQLAAATPTIRELILFKGSYVLRLYGSQFVFDASNSFQYDSIFIQIT